MNIQAGDEEVSATPSTNFTVLRVKRDILRRSTVGHDRDQPIGVERHARWIESGLWRRRGLRLLRERQSERLLRPHQDDGHDRATTRAIRSKFDYPADRYGAARRAPEGRRQRSIPRSAFCAAPTSRARSPRPASARGPASMKAVRKFSFEGSVEYFENGAGEVESRTADRPLQHRVRQQRSVHRGGERQLRSAGRAVPARRRRRRFRSAATTTAT